MKGKQCHERQARFWLRDAERDREEAKGIEELLLYSCHRRKVFGEGQDETMKRNTKQ